MHRAVTREVVDMVSERKMGIKSNTKIAKRDIGGESSGRRWSR